MPEPAIKQRKVYSLSQFTILVVDDYPFMATLLSSMLREFGVGRVLIAESGNDAINLIKLSVAEAGGRNHIDIALIDWLMPNGSGLDTIAWIRNHPKDIIRFLPAILVSAYASEAIVEAGRDNGFNEVLVKPVAAEKLAARILHVIDNPRPFVKTPEFFGPDRRRREKSVSSMERRKTPPEKIRVSHERI